MSNQIYQTANSIDRVRFLSASAKSNEIIGIQAMRYFAALAVLVDHLIVAMCEVGKLSDSWLPFAYKLGDVGVFLFFGISGFVMVLTNRDKFQNKGAPAKFFSRRLVRIWPMYFLATIVVFGMKYGSDAVYSVGNLFKSLAFIPYVGSDGLYRPILGKGWTLNYEMFFYVIFAICLSLRKSFGLSAACVTLIVLGVSTDIAGGMLWEFYANSIVLYFLVGIVLGYAIKDVQLPWKFSYHAVSAIGIAALLFLLLVYLNVVLDVSWGKQILMLLLVLACLYCVCFSETKFQSSVATRLVSLLGDASYCLYLFHGFFFFALKPLLKSFDNAAIIGILPIIIVAVTFGCVVIHLYVEKPITKLALKLVK